MATYADVKAQFLGIGEHLSTYYLKAGVTALDVGKLGAVTANGEWGLGVSDDAPIGVLRVYEADGFGAVQDAGYVEIDIVHDDAVATNEVQVGNWVQCDGTGKGAKASTCTGVRAIAVDPVNHKAIVLIGTP